MGVVYLAHDPILERAVAVKVVTPANVSPESVERFKREARVVAKMDHPAIVSVHDSGEHEGSLFFVMPFVEGTNLRIALRNQALLFGELIDAVVQVAEALEYSHARNVVHRDIKPENIMVSRETPKEIRVRITDFGLAMTPAQDRITKTETVVGTVTYMSPEQISGKEIDARSDIYSLGTLLYECLAGQVPFAGEIQSVVYRILHETPMPLRSTGADVDQEVEVIVARCLEKDPAKRPTGGEVAEAFSSYRARLQTSGRNRALPSRTTLTFHVQGASLKALVGREKECTELQRRLNLAVGGECQFVLVAGETGIGKTRLLEELENLSKARAIAVFHGRFVEQNHALPYEGYCEAIQEYFRARSGLRNVTPVDFSDLAPDLIALFPVLAEVRELSGLAEGSARPGDQGVKKFEDRSYIFELLARTITRMSGGKTMVLLLEDLHSADVSIEALDYVVRRLGPTPTFIVGTYRSSDVDKRHPIINLLNGFKGDRRFNFIQLAPFTASEHKRFLQELMGGSAVEEQLAAKFYHATEGNPYFAAELVHSLMDSGGIVKDESGVNRLSSETVISIEQLPVTIQQAVEERIERLSKELREVLSIASVLGKTFEFAHLEILAAEVDNLDNAVEQLIRIGFIEEDRQSRSDRLTFSSGVVRDVLYGSLHRRKRRAFHKRHAEELERKNQGRLDRIYADLFDHYVQADVPEKVIEYGSLLATKSLEAFSPEDAVRVARTVIDFLEEDSMNRHATGKAKMLLASAYRMSGNISEALVELDEALEIFEEEKDTPQVLQCILLAADISWQGRKIEETRIWVERGIDVAGLTEDAASLGKLLSIGAMAANLRGDYETGQKYLEEIQRLRPSVGEASEQAVEGGTLVVSLINECKARHPATRFYDEEGELLANIFEPLVTVDSFGNLLPLLCERWETQSDGAVFLFMLRKEARLQDGRKLTAQDVKHSFESSIRLCSRSLFPAFSTIRGVSEFLNGTSSEVTGVVALSENTIQIQLQDKLPIYAALLTDSRTGIAIESKENGGKTFVGTGPFKMTSSTADTIRLDRNPDYWKGIPAHINGIEFKIVPGSAEVGKGFREGKYDVVRDLEPRDLETILRDQSLHPNLVETPKRNIYFVAFNLQSAICKNPEIRKALSGIVRLHDLVRSTLGRFAEPAEGLLPPGILGHDPGRRRHSISAEEANELIESSGFPRPLHLKASVHPLIQSRYSSLIEALFKNWSEIGINVSIVTSDASGYADSFKEATGIDLLIGRWIADYEDPDSLTFSLFHSRVGELRNYYSSKEMDELMEAARASGEPKKREMLYRRIDSFPSEKGFLLPLFHEVDYRIANQKVRNLSLTSIPPYLNYLQLSKAEAIQPVPQQRTDRGILGIPIAGDLLRMDPAMSITTEQATVLSTVYDTLTRASEGAMIIPWLASEFQAEKSGASFRFRLRDGVRFHDGRRLTARDVRYSFEHVLQSKQSQNSVLLKPIRGAGRIMSGDARELEGFQIISALEFEIEMEHPLAFFPALLASAVSIIPENSVNFVGNWREGCVGTGPYRIDAFDPGRTLKVQANPGYWRPGVPKNDGLEFTFGCSPSEIMTGFRNKRFSIAWNLFPSDVETLRHDSRLFGNYHEIPILSTYYLSLNIHREPLNDETIRRRLIQSLDVEQLVRKNAGGLAVPAYSLTPPGLLGYEPATSVPTHTGQKKEGTQQVELKVVLHSVYEGLYASLTRGIFEILQEAGFTLQIVEKKGEDRFLREFPEAHLNFTRWFADYPDVDSFMQSLLESDSGFDGPFCGMPEIDRLIEKGRAEAEPARRHSLYRQIEEILQNHALLLPLFHEKLYAFSRQKVDGLALNFFNPAIPFEELSIRR